MARSRADPRVCQPHQTTSLETQYALVPLNPFSGERINHAAANGAGASSGTSAKSATTAATMPNEPLSERVEQLRRPHQQGSTAGHPEAVQNDSSTAGPKVNDRPANAEEQP